MDGGNGSSPNGTDNVPATSAEPTFWQKARKYWSYVSIEPVAVCWILPSCLGLIAIQNLELEKGCRVNFNNTVEVCMNMIDKAINNIVCDTVLEKESNLTKVLKAQSNRTKADFPEYAVSALEHDVCQAEVNSQILDAQLNGYTAPIEAVFGILMILFAAGWSDRRGLRKPCILLPMIGELSALVVYLIASIWFDQLPMEFNSVLGRVLPALSGKENLMLLGIFSYLTDTTPEEDRTFRFGIFATFIQIFPVVFIPFSGYLFEKLRYVYMFILGIFINLVGIFYLIFVLKEVKPKKKDTDGVDNPAFEKSKGDGTDNQNSNGRQKLKMDEPAKPKSCLLDFFNPIVAVECAKLIVKVREFNARRTVILLLVLYFIVQFTAGEDPNEYSFTRIKLNWGGEEYGPYVSFGSFTAIIGTILMVGGAAKLFGLADALVGFMSTACSAVARLIFANVSSTLWMYIARVIDMFVSVRALTLKSLISVVVDSDEIGKVFSIMGILEMLGKSVYVPIYAQIYENTLSLWAGSFYIFSFFVLVVAAILFLAAHIVVKNLTTNRQENEDNVDKIDIQVTHM